MADNILSSKSQGLVDLDLNLFSKIHLVECDRRLKNNFTIIPENNHGTNKF